MGRERELAAIIDSLLNDYCRLLTLVGPGGIGKTRLSLEAGRRLLESTEVGDARGPFPDGVFVVNLQAATAHDDVVPAIAQALGFEFFGAGDRMGQLARHNQDKRLLLILDNMEHLLEAGGLLHDFLAATAQPKILVTSREPLDMAEEYLFHVEGMLLPHPHTADAASADVAAMEGADAVRLFVARARRARHDFSPGDHQKPGATRGHQRGSCASGPRSLGQVDAI